VEEEGNRLSGLIKNAMDNAKQGPGGSDLGNPEEKKGFWGKLFNKE